jgi:hypothetical protein
MDIFSELNNENSNIKNFGADYFIFSIIQLIKGVIGKYQKIGLVVLILILI